MTPSDRRFILRLFFLQALFFCLLLIAQFTFWHYQSAGFENDLLWRLYHAPVPQVPIDVQRMNTEQIQKTEGIP